MEMLEHVPDPAAVVEACARLAKPGGYVFFSTINRSPKSFLFAILGAEYLLRLWACTENPKYRAALLSNPKGTIEKQLNTQLGAVTVKAVADTADTVHVVIPYAAAEGELSDADLERVAGGKQDITANCLVLGGTAVSNTVMQLNL